MTEMPSPQRGLMERLGFGAVLNALVLLVGLTAWAVTVHNQADMASHDLIKLDTSMTDKIAELRAVTTAGLTDVRNQIAVLPDQRARIDILERRAADLDTRLGSIGQMLATQQQSDLQSKADINQLLRTVNQPLVRQPR